MIPPKNNKKQPPSLPLEIIIRIIEDLAKIDAQCANKACLVANFIPLSSLDQGVYYLPDVVLWRIGPPSEDNQSETRSEERKAIEGISDNIRSIAYIREGEFRRKLVSLTLYDGNAIFSICSYDFTSLQELTICNASINTMKKLPIMPNLTVMILISDQEFNQNCKSNRMSVKFNKDVQLPLSLRHNMKRWDIQKANLYLLTIIRSKWVRIEAGRALRHRREVINESGFHAIMVYTIEFPDGMIKSQYERIRCAKKLIREHSKKFND